MLLICISGVQFSVKCEGIMYVSPCIATSPPPEAPPLTVTVINSTSVSLAWSAPPPFPDRTLLAYVIRVVRVGRVGVNEHQVGAEQLTLTLTALAPGATYTINISALYLDDTEGSMGSHTVTLPPEQGGGAASVVNQPWFYAVVAVGGAIMLSCALILACCICYQLCCKTGQYKG